MADTRPAAESRGTPERRDASPPRGTTLRDAVREIGVPRILIAVFFLALLAVAYTTHMDMPSLLGDCILRIARNGLLGFGGMHSGVDISD